MSLSQSGITTWFSCPRKWRYTYVDGYESVSPPSKEQRFGTAFHKMLEAYYLYQPAPDTGLDGTELASSLALFEKYKQLYPLPSGIIGAEIPFKLDGIHGVFDAVYRREDGSIVVVEHKTTKSDFAREEIPGVPSYWDRVRTDWQVGMYQLAAREVYGTSKVSILYDVIRVPQLRQKKNESVGELRERIAVAIDEAPMSYFGQGEVRWTDANLAGLREDLRDVAMAVATAKESGRYPRSRKCLEWNRACEWQPVCFQGAALSDERLYQVRTRR